MAVNLDQARALVTDGVSAGGWELVPLLEACGRVLAKPVVADFSFPREARSRFDGFALGVALPRGAVGEGGRRFQLEQGLLAAGSPAGADPLLPGCCIRVLTGAPLPHGVQAVVRQEEVVVDGNGLFLDRECRAQEGIVRAGDDFERGELLVGRGEILTPTRLSLAAAAGVALLAVCRRPRVALLGTGDELREPGEVLEGPSSYCNNRYLLGWLAAQLGAEVIHLGLAGDDRDALVERLQGVSADLIITTGGVGKGDRDLVSAAWERLGVERRFREVRVSPGRRSCMGISGDQAYFGLPGNPWAAQFIFQELVVPRLLRLQGLSRSHGPTFQAVLGRSLTKSGGLCQAVRGNLRWDRGRAVFDPAIGPEAKRWAHLGSNCGYVLLEEETEQVEAGDRVEVRLHDLSLAMLPFWGNSCHMGKD